MENYQKELLISRIRAGYIRYKDIRIYPALPDVEYEANEVFIDTYDRCLNDGVLSDQDIYNFMVSHNLWSEDQQLQIDKIIPSKIESLKVEIFQNYFKSNTKENLRRYLRTIYNTFLHLLNIRHTYSAYSAIGIANFAKNMYILYNSCRYKNGNNVDWDLYNINDIIYYYQSQQIDLTTIRELARTLPWTHIWNSYKKCGKPIFINENLTQDQQAIVQWSSLYDNIQESQECPPDDIINDDDALDGWLILQKKERDRGKNEKTASSNSKIDQADEIFIVAETTEDAARVQNLNNQAGVSVISNRIKQVNEKGIIQQQDFGDIQQNILMQANNAQFDTIRNSKNG